MALITCSRGFHQYLREFVAAATLDGASMEKYADEYYHRIRTEYLQSGSDSGPLFETVLSAAEVIGLDQALACLEQCVIEKRLAWLAERLPTFERTDNPVLDGYRLFYETYLGIAVPADGEIVEQTGRRLVCRWWNACPTLIACQNLGLDTRQICRKAYHWPVQLFLTQLDPRLRFERNYEALRPHTAYCEEIITLVEET